MAQSKKIWRRKGRKGDSRPGHWYTWRGKQCIYVADRDKSYGEAWELYCANYSAPPANSITVQVVINRYLTWAEHNLKASTHKWHQHFLSGFAHTISSGLTVAAMKRWQIQEWLDQETTWNGTTKNRAVASLNACLNWAHGLEYISANPAHGFKAPSRSTGRRLWLDGEKFQILLGHVTDNCFKEYLTFAFETGARPQETRILEARHWDGEKFILNLDESKGEEAQRVIYCNNRMRRLVTGLVRLAPVGPIFTNEDGKPWKPSAVRSRFIRTPKKKGQPASGLALKMGMKGLCAYTMRHSFCTNALIAGLDVVAVAALMGHKDATMVMRVYQHLAKDHAYLLKAANRATDDAVVLSGLELPAPIPLSLPAPDTPPTAPV